MLDALELLLLDCELLLWDELLLALDAVLADELLRLLALEELTLLADEAVDPDEEEDAELWLDAVDALDWLDGVRDDELLRSDTVIELLLLLLLPDEEELELALEEDPLLLELLPLLTDENVLADWLEGVREELELLDPELCDDELCDEMLDRLLELLPLDDDDCEIELLERVL